MIKNKTRLHFCETHYSVKPPVDINPLVLELYKDKKVLAICAKQQMVDRIDKLEIPRLLACGWWEVEEIDLYPQGYLDYSELFSYDVVVVIGRKRIDEKFWPLLFQLEKAFPIVKYHS